MIKPSKLTSKRLAELMGFSALPTVGHLKPANLVLIVLDNGVYLATGGQPTAAVDTDFAAAAQATGWAAARTIDSTPSALQEALHLAKYADPVTIVTRSETLKARRSLVDRAAGHDAIAFRWETEVAEIVGDDGVTAVTLRDVKSGAVDEMACAGVFVYIGLEPNAAWLDGAATLDPRGFVVTDGDTLETSQKGLFAAGAIRSGYGGRLTQAIGEATTAALSAARFVRS